MHHFDGSFDDLSSPAALRADCEAVRGLAGVAAAASRPAPSLRFEDYPHDVVKRDVEVAEAAQRIANALHLHLD